MTNIQNSKTGLRTPKPLGGFDARSPER